jgi:hypothetical protein
MIVQGTVLPLIPVIGAPKSKTPYLS